ncbi:hypothetical protein RQP46_011053 [Phenoliferia psychrophenolica]
MLVPFSFSALLALYVLPNLVSARTGPARVWSHGVTKRATLFAPLSYSAGQISDGVAGNASAEAQAVCTQPFADIDLSTVSQTDMDNLETFREAAETAETAQFDPQIDAASGTAADSLQVGKIKNKVLKLTCEVQQLQSKQAQGSDVTSDLATEQKKLDTNIKTDQASAGQASTGVVSA